MIASASTLGRNAEARYDPEGNLAEGGQLLRGLGERPLIGLERTTFAKRRETGKE
jgi:hypothetical protein